MLKKINFLIIFTFYISTIFGKIYDFEFLNTPFGARSVGLGENFVAFDDSAESLYYNPACASFVPRSEVAVAYNLYFSGSYINQFSLSLPFRTTGLGINMSYLKTPNIDYLYNYTELGTYSLRSFVGSGVFGFQLARWLGLGASVKYFNQKIVDYRYSDYLYNVGALFKTYNDVFSFGLAFENYPLNSLDVQQFFNLGFAFKFNLPRQSSKINILMSSKFDRATKKPVYSFGIEHWGSDVLGLRAGYIYDVEKQQQDVYQALSFFRAGISLNIGNFGIDYAYIPNYPLQNTHNVGFNYRFRDRQKIVSSIHKDVNLEVEPKYFSPNNDGYLDNIFFIHDATDTSNVISSAFIIRDNQGNIITQIYSSTQTSKVDRIFTFSGKDPFTGEFLRDGVYTVEFELFDKKGAKQVVYKSERKEFVIDKTAPEIDVILSTDTISPDDDGIDDAVGISVKIYDDLSPIENLVFRILTSKNKVIKSEIIDVSSQTTNSKNINILWDGLDEVYGKPVPNGEYTLKFLVKNLSGNKKEVASKVRVNIPQKMTEKEIRKLIYVKKAKVSLEERGIVITYQTDELFNKGTAIINPLFNDSISSLVDVIKSNFSDRKILIEAYTDSVGDAQENLRKSESYAKSFYSYLIKNFKINYENIQVKGMGESNPVSSNKTKLGRAKNRRLEIIIQ